MNRDYPKAKPGFKKVSAIPNGISLESLQWFLVEQDKIFQILVDICKMLCHATFYRIGMAFFLKVDVFKGILFSEFDSQGIE